MAEPIVQPAAQATPRSPGAIAVRGAMAAAGLILLAGCATQPQQHLAAGGRYFDPKLGVYASDRVVSGDDPVPRGGGSYLVGRPYVIAGRSYVPSDHPRGYAAVGTASWYGDAFHGRRTANGEVFDRTSISAAHPTLPLPSYVRVTNLGNGRSMIVRVNDRGPYHGNRVMDVSQRVAETLDFRRAGTARIRVEYVGKAPLQGDDDQKLVATLRTDGGLAQLAGYTDGGTGPAVAAAEPSAPAPERPASAMAPRVARTNDNEATADEEGTLSPAPEGRFVRAPLPPARPFEVSLSAPAAVPGKTAPMAAKTRPADKLAALLQKR